MLIALLHLALASHDCTPSFPFKDGWKGADAVYSVVLPDGRDLWLFGDTLVSDEPGEQRMDPEMINNSLGLSRCVNGKFELEYAWRGGVDKPQSFFVPDGDYFYWPMHGFEHEGKVHVFLHRIVLKKDVENALSFEFRGVTVATLSNLQRPMGEWKVSYEVLTRGEHVFPGASVFKKDGYLYAYAFMKGHPRFKNHPLTLTRWKLEGLGSFSDVEVLFQGSQWVKTQGRFLNRPEVVARTHIVMEEAASELSLRFDPRINKWVALHIKNAELGESLIPTAAMVMKVADLPEGPFQEERVVYRAKEMKEGDPAFDPDNFCYATKEHPQYARGGQSLMTYVCNSYDISGELKKVKENVLIYRPRVQWVRPVFPAPRR